MRLTDICHWGPKFGQNLLLGSVISLGLLGGACAPKDRVSISNDGGAGTANTAGSGGNAAGTGNGTAGNGGTGPVGSCKVDADCPGAAIECAEPRCGSDGKCFIYQAPVGTLVTDGVDGNCTSQVCNGTGLIASTKLDPQDVPDSSDQCIVSICNSDGTVGSKLLNNTMCVVGSTESVCNNGICDACYGADGIALCQSGCAACENGQVCIDNEGCQSKNCSSVTGSSNRTCQAARCDDMILNGSESDVDCGGEGTGCGRCADDRACTVNSDCKAGSTCVLRSEGKFRQCSSTSAPSGYWESFNFTAASLDGTLGKENMLSAAYSGTIATSPWGDSLNFGVSCLHVSLEQFSNFTPRKLTLSFWHQPTDKTLTDGLLVEFANIQLMSSTSSGLNIRNSKDPSNQGTVGLPVNVNEWNHILLSLDYAELQATLTVNSKTKILEWQVLGDTTGMLGIGCASSDSSPLWTMGNIDELYLYQRLLGSDEVTNYYLANSALLP